MILLSDRFRRVVHATLFYSTYTFTSSSWIPYKKLIQIMYLCFVLNKDTDEQIKSVDILQCIYYIVMIVLGIVNFLRSISA